MFVIRRSAAITLVFESALGWMATQWSGRQLARISFGYISWEPAVAWMNSSGTPHAHCLAGAEPDALAIVDGQGELQWVGESPHQDESAVEAPREVLQGVARLRAYAAGEGDELARIELDLSGLTPFRRRVTEACRRIPYGCTVSYAELARQVGAPRAARAVGNVMRTNPWPLVIPCHRVLSTGGLGGYSAPEGLTMKKRLLALEAAASR